MLLHRVGNTEHQDVPAAADSQAQPANQLAQQKRLRDGNRSDDPHNTTPRLAYRMRHHHSHYEQTNDRHRSDIRPKVWNQCIGLAYFNIILRGSWSRLDSSLCVRFVFVSRKSQAKPTKPIKLRTKSTLLARALSPESQQSVLYPRVYTYLPEPRSAEQLVSVPVSASSALSSKYRHCLCIKPFRVSVSRYFTDK